MKKIIILLAVVMLASCNSSKEKNQVDKSESSTITSQEKNENMNKTIPHDGSEMMMGETNREGLQMDAFKSWFNPGYSEYKVDSETLASLKPLLKDVNITVFMGTWCEDSHRDVPQLYKILDEAKFDESKLRVIALDEDKTSPEGIEKEFNIQQVPTIIFYKNNKELGRIVEYPIQTLEKDMHSILSGKDYKHAYDY